MRAAYREEIRNPIGGELIEVCAAQEHRGALDSNMPSVWITMGDDWSGLMEPHTAREIAAALVRAAHAAEEKA